MLHRKAASFSFHEDDEDKRRQDQIDRKESRDRRPEQLSQKQPRVETMRQQERDKKIVRRDEPNHRED